MWRGKGKGKQTNFTSGLTNKGTKRCMIRGGKEHKAAKSAGFYAMSKSMNASLQHVTSEQTTTEEPMN